MILKVTTNSRLVLAYFWGSAIVIPSASHKDAQWGSWEVLQRVLWEIGSTLGVLPRVLREIGGASGSVPSCGASTGKSSPREHSLEHPRFP